MNAVWTENERAWMRRAIKLAAPYRTHPNPRVGCVIVDSEGRIVGVGAHRGVGADHAEQEALKQVGDAARGGTAIVTLEPCSHYGRTPPCAEALVEAGIARVVAAIRDPDRRVRGRGLDILAAASGVTVSVGLLRQEAVDLDPAYHHHRRTGRPFVRAFLPEDCSDPAVRADAEALCEEVDLMLTGEHLPAGHREPGSMRRSLVRLGEQGFLSLGVREEGLISRLRRAGLVDAVTAYSRNPEPEAGSVWNNGLYRTVTSQPVGSRYRIDRGILVQGASGLVRRGAEAAIPTRHGDFRAIGYESVSDGRHHVALVKGDVEGKARVLVRIHSECLTGDVFGSLRCDCGFQLDESLRLIGGEDMGAVVYIRGHEGRGIGLMHKLAAYALQEQGRDTVEANLDLGFPGDGREYGVGAEILTDLGITGVRLLTNNPTKGAGLRENGVNVVEMAPLVVGENDHNRSYLRTKVSKLGHMMDLGG